MTNNDEAEAPVFTLQQFTNVLMNENEWDEPKAHGMAVQIAASQDWPMDSSHTESQWIWAALAWWGKHPVPEDEEGSVFM